MKTFEQEGKRRKWLWTLQCGVPHLNAGCFSGTVEELIDHINQDDKKDLLERRDMVNEALKYFNYDKIVLHKVIEDEENVTKVRLNCTKEQYLECADYINANL